MRCSLALSLCLALIATGACSPDGDDGEVVLAGEARRGSVTVALPEASLDVAVRGRAPATAPLVLVDPGHGGSDPGAPGVGGQAEKTLALAMARELADRLAADGQVRVALTRSGDSYPSLEQRAALAGRLGAGLFVSLHMDSAPNPMAAGMTVYSLSDIASSAEAARFARAENEGPAGPAVTSETDPTLKGLLGDVALRDQMEASAEVAQRLVRALGGAGVPLRPRPHQFADFHVLRRSGAPAVLVEAGYISNAADAARLADPAKRARAVASLARAIEAYLLTAGQ